ncbi:MAG: ATPase [Vampirovibrionia bacterium]
MIKLLADAGTSWTKILEIYDNKQDLSCSQLATIINDHNLLPKLVSSNDNDGNQFFGRYLLIPTKVIHNIPDIQFDAATGHMSSRRLKEKAVYENELVALALGGMKVIDEPDVTLLDLGSRDSKWIRYKDYKYSDLDWNGTCGSGTGATIEMVCNFYDYDPQFLPVEEEKIAVTCGVFGMEKIMDLIAKGVSADVAISRYIHGIAFNVWNFAQRPDKLYLSGGLCLNDCFVKSLKQYCDVVILGRYVLLEGLY